MVKSAWKAVLRWVLSVVMCCGVLWWAVCRCVLCEEEDCVTVSLTPGSLVLVFLVTADTALHCCMLHYTAPCWYQYLQPHTGVTLITSSFQTVLGGHFPYLFRHWQKSREFTRCPPGSPQFTIFPPRLLSINIKSFLIKVHFLCSLYADIDILVYVETHIAHIQQPTTSSTLLHHLQIIYVIYVKVKIWDTLYTPVTPF